MRRRTSTHRPAACSCSCCSPARPVSPCSAACSGCASSGSSGWPTRAIKTARRPKPIVGMTRFDPASFRDPSGRLFRHSGSLYRTCSVEALNAYTRARESGLLDQLEASGRLVPTTVVSAEAEGLSPADVGPHVLKQPELPVVSYSYEWSFSMLRDAARLTLD